MSNRIRARVPRRVLLLGVIGLAAVTVAIAYLIAADPIGVDDDPSGGSAHASSSAAVPADDGFAMPFLFPSPSASEPTGDPWAMHAMVHRGANGEVFAYTCPPNGTPGVIWGTLIYTDDSSVCTAAVHQGVITVEAGGTVWIRIRSGLPAYTGTPRHGIASQPWDRWDGSFVIIEP